MKVWEVTGTKKGKRNEFVCQYTLQDGRGTEGERRIDTLEVVGSNASTNRINHLQVLRSISGEKISGSNLRSLSTARDRKSVV